MYTWGMRANSVGKKSVEVSNAYLAGLIDGDGSIMAIIEKHPAKKFGWRVRIVLKVTQKHEADLLFLVAMTNCGAVSKNGETYDWKTRDQNMVKEVLLNIQPYSRIKHNQVTIALQILNSDITSLEDLQAVATLADALSRFNVRSNNRRKNYVTKIQTLLSSND